MTLAQGGGTPPLKKRKLSKHKKRNQRLTNIDDEVHAQQGEQDEIRMHGGLLAAKKDKELFNISTEKMSVDEMAGVVKLSRKERARNKVSMIDRIINPVTKIKPVSALRSKSNRAEADQTRLLARQQSGKPPKRLINSSDSGKYDLWSESKEKTDTFSVNLPKMVDGKGMGHGVKKYRKSGNEMTSFSKGTERKIRGNLLEEKIEIHPGQSYNPQGSAHQDLLRKEHQKILSEKQRKEKTERAVAWDYENAATAETDLTELRQGLFEEEEDWVTDEEEVPVEKIVALPDNMPKTALAKKRYKAAMEKKKVIDAKKQINHIESQVYNAKKFLKEMTVRDKVIDEKSEKKKDWENKKMPRVGKTKFEEPDQELKLTDEIMPTLRQLVPEGNIMKDRYQSMVKRAIIEPHTVHKHKYMRKYKRKTKMKRRIRLMIEENEKK